MANVTTNIISFKPHKWDTAVFTWDNEMSAVDWDNAGNTAWSVKVSGDTFLITDGEKNVFEKCWTDILLMKEAMSNNVSKRIASALTLSESFYRNVNYGIRASESFYFAEKLSKAISITKKENTNVLETLRNNTTKNSFNTLALDEVFDREVKYYLNIDELQGIADTISQKYGLNKNTALSVIDDYYRACNMVISDISFFDSDKSVSDLSSRDVPVGFAPFREFIPGDWLYKDAIFKMVIESSDTSATPGVSEWKLNIDVPDVFDKGTCECKAGKTSSVTFNRRFWDIPDITIKIRGEDSASLHIANLVTTIDGFTFDLMDSSNTQVTGTIYWKAEGY